MTAGRRISWLTYFKNEKKWLLLTAVTGMIYNVGMTAGPYFEGQLAQCLYDIFQGRRTGYDMLVLALFYVLVIALVQGARALKRLYVRKFANAVSRAMKENIYHHLIHESYARIQQEDTGAMMTRAIADADACAEGMRKFTTEVFDTGVVMVAYLAMLLGIDWKLTLIVLVFPPVAYIASAALKKKVTASAAESRMAMSRLNNAAVDAISHALTYRIYGEDGNRAAAYEKDLTVYERKNVMAGIWQNSPQPLYLVISMFGVIPILWLGGKNVLGQGWTVWSIAAFSSYLSCFTKLAVKSSHAAKLFNAVQKAQVSWLRIAGYLTEREPTTPKIAAKPGTLQMQQVHFKWADGSFALHDLQLTAHPGEIIGITGKVASGKSTFGKLFLQEYPYAGYILYDGKDICYNTHSIFAYAGHTPELFTGTVEDNITFGKKDEKRLQKVLEEVQIAGEVTPALQVGMEGNALSGGQQARLALARALYSQAPVLILDDPFAAVDAVTEKKIFQALRQQESWRIILLISHRMAMFPQMDQIGFLQGGTLRTGRHEELMENPDYAALYHLQCQARKEAE